MSLDSGLNELLPNIAIYLIDSQPCWPSSDNCRLSAPGPLLPRSKPSCSDCTSLLFDPFEGKTSVLFAVLILLLLPGKM